MDVIAIGDVTEDVFVQVNDAHLITHGNHQRELALPFGTKLAIDRVDKLLGGNAGNVAIGSSRLGLRSALCSDVGDDTQGELLRQSLTKDKVSTKYFSLKKGEATNYSVILNYGDERTILVHHEPRTYKFPRLVKSAWVYLTSMGKDTARIFSPLLQHVKKNKVKLAFNPGTHQLNLGLRKLEPLLAATEILFVNVEEAQQLLSTKKRDLPFLLRTFNEIGVRIVVITDGEKGSYAYNGAEYWYCPIYKVVPVERTGCGDSYATGFMCARQYGENIAEAMIWGAINSSSVLRYVGPQAGLLTATRLREIRNANLKFEARTLKEKEMKRNREYVPTRFKEL